MGVAEHWNGQTCPLEERRAGTRLAVPDTGGDVPSGIYPVPQFRSDPTPRGRPGLPARLRTRWRRSKLDRQLAAGADPRSSAALTLRAAQLSSAGGRSWLANALVETLGHARGPNLGAFKPKTRRADAATRAAADDLLALVLRLRDDRQIEVQGAAMAARLLNDRGGPLHGDGGQDLRDALRAARTALDAPDSATQDLAAAA
jgi:hypothetical protein